MLCLIRKEILLRKTIIDSFRAFSLQTTIRSSNVTQSSINVNVPGLSNKCCAVPNTTVGPGASKDKEYKNPEYFCYHIESFAEAEVELEKFRLPAPSNKKPFNP